MKLNILLVNPPIYDFSAYDFWLKPYGLLRVAGALSKQNIYYFNFLSESYKKKTKEDGRGKFLKKKVEKPKAFSDIDKPFYRYGADIREFEDYLNSINKMDYLFLTSSMTYWYIGLKEVIDTVRKRFPKVKVVLGGIYATLLKEHAQKNLDVDYVLSGNDLSPLKDFLMVDLEELLPKWELEKKLTYCVITISSGCPFRCSYCAINFLTEGFYFKNEFLLKGEVEAISKTNVKNIAFYDDALLFRFDSGLKKFLELTQNLNFSFFTPNGLSPRMINKEVAKILREAKFEKLFVSLESIDEKFLKESGNKLQLKDFFDALENLYTAGFDKNSISVYLLFGHPEIDIEYVKEAIVMLKKEGIKIHLAEFSPVPHTSDFVKCAKFSDLNEPLNHNKVAFTIRVIGLRKYQEIKSLAKGKGI